MIRVKGFEANIYPSFKDSHLTEFYTKSFYPSYSFIYCSKSFYSILSEFSSDVFEELREFNKEANPKAIILMTIIKDSGEIESIPIFVIEYIRNCLIASPDQALIDFHTKGGNFK